MAPRYVLSDSEVESESDELAPSVPSDKALERALRDAVVKIYKSGKMEELTVKRVRLAVEKALELDEGFFKASSEWKTKSEQIIKDEVEVQDKAAQVPEHEKDVSPPPSKTAKPTKRTKSTTASTSRKRRKTSSPEPDEDEEEEEEAASESPSDSEVEVKKPTKRQPKKTDKKPQQKASKDIVSDESDLSEEPDVKPKEAEVDVKDDSESEMSIVLDEEPKPSRKRQKSADAPSQKAKKKTTTTTKTTTKGKEADVDPDQAEIKRLQGWLVKCGIRKVWSRELAPYGTSKDKVKHLKKMLKEVGMEGRYSLEKARKIKEERELKADLEMIQEGAKHWGKGGEEESDGGNRPRRRLNRGQQSLAFLESDGEETD